MKNYYNTTSIQKQQQNDRPSLRLNVNVDSSLNRRSKSSSSSPLTATRSNYSPFFSLNYNAERLFPLRKKIYIGKIKHIHNRTSDDDDYYDDDDDYPEHFKWIDYGNMKPKQIEAIKSFCCNQSILFILALIIYALWHSVFYKNLNDLDRQTIEFWFTDFNEIQTKNLIEQFKHQRRLSNDKIELFDSWIIMIVLFSSMIFIFGMVAMCYRSHNNTRAMKIYRWIVIPMLIIIIIALLVFTMFLFKFWIRFANGSSIRFIYDHYNDHDNHRWLMIYVHHTNQWLNCCDWFYLLHQQVSHNNNNNNNKQHTTWTFNE
nr:uncharacterized protein LOC124495353 [Dermatophagoides farinae]